jgi:hypothetical protein
MADTIRIKRRAAGGAAGAPTALAAAELAFNEQDDTLYYGKGNNAGQATNIVAIGGGGAFPSKSYVDSADALRVLKAGDAMTGPLVLPADPTSALQAATKQYVDAHAGTGGISEAPSDGKYYTRRNATWADGATQFAPLASPVFTGDPKAPTPATADNDTSIATTAFVKAQGYLVGNQTVTLSGDVTGSGATAITATVAANAIDNTKLADMATARLKGRVTTATGDPEDLTGTQATTLLDVFTSTLKGLAPSSGGGTANFLRADGSWAVPPAGSGGITDAPSDGNYYGRQNAAWAQVAPLASPTFTGDPQAPTPATADNDTSIATTAFVKAQGYLTTAAAGAGYQPLDADLTAIAALSGINVIYYRSAADTWSAVTIGTGLSFSSGTLSSTVSTAGLAPLASPVFTGDPQAPTPATGDNDTSVATTAFVKAQGYVTGGPFQPLDADLTAIAALTGTNVIYYRSAPDTWAAVTVGTGLSFSGGSLTATGSGVAIADTPPGSPSQGQLWWESDTGKLWINYNDGTSTQFVSAIGGGGVLAPQVTILTSGSGTWPTPAGATYLEVEMVGGGGGGGANGLGAAGTATTFGTSFLNAGGGAGGTLAGANSAGGTATGGTLNIPGSGGGAGAASLSGNFAGSGGHGGASAFGGAGAAGYSNPGGNAAANSGSGGGGAACNSTATSGPANGGASGGYVYALITSPAASYPYAIGVGGNGGSAGGIFGAGGRGGDGCIKIIAHFGG